MKKDWKKAYRLVCLDKGKTVGYRNPKYPEFEIQSRTRSIPHANGEGTWSYTDYAVVGDDGEKIFHSLGDAVEWVEQTAEREGT